MFRWKEWKEWSRTLTLSMSPLPRIAVLLVYISAIAWVYLYLYPIWHGCGFPLTQAPSLPPSAQLQFPYFQHDPARQAPFRLLVLADPQLEGDTSLPKTDWSWAALTPQELGDTVGRALKYWRKKLDLWGNDRYLGHIYRSLQTFTQPTHVTVLGDLLGSQWISDEEFDRRADRFWKVVFAGSEPVPEHITRQPHKEILGEQPSWRHYPMVVVGNHDVGYAGDMNVERVERFERRFGRVNWDVEFELPAKGGQELESGSMQRPSIRIQILNSMNLDTPAYDDGLQTETYAALNNFIERSRDVYDPDVFTVLLTHVPLYKPEGVCTDVPWFDYYDEDSGGGIREQNLLSDHASKQLLEGIFGMSDTSPGRNGIILTGHDHTGCDVWHYLPVEGPNDNLYRWNATRLLDHLRGNATAGRPGLREVTLRAMMGDYEGNAAFLSAWYDEDEKAWGYAVAKCEAGPQHYWWVVHVIFLVSALVASIAAIEYQFSAIKVRNNDKRRKNEREVRIRAKPATAASGKTNAWKS